MTSRSRSRHRKRRREYTVDTDSFGRRSSRRSFRRSNQYQYSHQSNSHRSFYYQSNNYYPLQFSEPPSHTHYHRHNHHHYHHHHHHNQGRAPYGFHKPHSLALSHGRSDRRKLSHKTTVKHHQSISSGFSDGNESDDPPPDDLEGTVNLKGVSSLHRKRYCISKRLGQGTFGLVIECIDNKRKMCVAVKIVRSVKRYLDAADIEVDILNKLDSLDHDRNSLIIRLYKSFRTVINEVEHSCLVFERCGKSLYDYIKKNKYRGFPLPTLAVVAFQLFHSIAFCHRHKLTHTDLKLENILFISDSYVRDKKSRLYLPRNSCEIRLIDFGGATFESDHHSSVINTRQYRGPEVILGLRWSYPSDVWSIGCILAELYCGELLFATHHDTEHLHLIRKMVGEQFPGHMLNHQNVQMLQWPTSNASTSLTSAAAKSMKYIEKSKALHELIGNGPLLDLIGKCLRIDPAERIMASQGKTHPFFMQFRNNKAENQEFMKIYHLINRV